MRGLFSSWPLTERPEVPFLADLSLFSRSNERDSAGVKVRARRRDVRSAAVIVTASARKKLPVTPDTAIKGRKTTTGVIVDPINGVVISRRAERTASMRV